MSSPTAVLDPFDVIYHWWSGGKYLAYASSPRAKLIEARLDHSVEDVISLLPAGTGHFLFHINCTRTDRFPASRRDLVARLESEGVHVINRNVTDISKRSVQRACHAAGLNTLAAPRSGLADETIFVKTDSNAGGDSEHQLTPAELEELGIPPPSSEMRYCEQYAVMPRRSVPDRYWSDPAIVCERFVTNAGNVWYRAYLLYNRMTLCRLASTSTVKKVGNSRVERVWHLDESAGGVPDGADHDRVGPVVDHVRRMQRAYALEFGTIDVLVDDEERPFICDLNPTPGYRHPVDGLVDHLIRAIPPQAETTG